MMQTLPLYFKKLNLKKNKTFFFWKNYYKKFILKSLKNITKNFLNNNQNIFFIIFSFIEKKNCINFLYDIYKYNKNKNYFFSFLLLQKNNSLTFLQIFKNIELKKKNDAFNIGFIFFLTEFELVEFLKTFFYYKDVFFCYLFFGSKYFIFNQQNIFFLKTLNFFYSLYFLYKNCIYFLYYLDIFFNNIFNNLLYLAKLLNNWKKLLI